MKITDLLLLSLLCTIVVYYILFLFGMTGF
jgi:hypothetical protein